MDRDQPDSDSLEAFLAGVKADAESRAFFPFTLLNPTFHWFFSQGQKALEGELYLPGVSSLLNGIEASLRVTLAELKGANLDELDLAEGRTLSNPLLREARDAGLPIELLKWSDETDFLENLETKTSVGIVKLRHDICHGNILQFVGTVEGEDIKYFTPECLRPTAAQLLNLSFGWAHGLALFRSATGLRSAKAALPDVPANPLAQWLPA